MRGDVNAHKLICSFIQVYLPTDATNGEDTISLFAMVGTSNVVAGNAVTLVANYTWNIKIEQIDCTKNNDLEGKVFLDPRACVK